MKVTARMAAVLTKAEEVTKENLEKEEATYGNLKRKGKGKLARAKQRVMTKQMMALKMMMLTKPIAKAFQAARGKADKTDDKACKDEAVSEEDDDGNKGKGSLSPRAEMHCFDRT